MNPLRMALFHAFIGAATVTSAQQVKLNRVEAAIEEIMRARSAAGDFSGAVLVARDGRILYQRAFGMANLEWQIPNDLQTKF